MTTKSATWRPGATVCRCCLAEGCYKDIATEYFWMGKREVYSEMLNDTFDVSIAYSQAGGPNSNSRLICEPCISRLRDASEFKRQVQECEKTFMQYLEPGSSATTEVNASVDSEKDVKLEDVKQEKEESDEDYGLPDDFPDDDGDDDDDIDDQPLTKLASKIPKKEEEAVDLLDFLDPPKVAEKRKSAAKAKSSPAKKAKTTEAKASVSKVKSPPEKKKKGEDQMPLQPVEKEEQKNAVPKTGTGSVPTIFIEQTLAQNRIRKMNDADKMKIARGNAIKLLECSKICPFKWMKNLFLCFYCDNNFSDPVLLRDHNIKEHASTKYNKLKRALDKLKKYELVKTDITNAECKMCDEVVKDFTDLKLHLLHVHAQMIELNGCDGILPFKLIKGDFRCALCNEKYVEFKTLNQHMNVHFQNFICELCGTGFVTPERLRTHAYSHGNGHFPCTACNKVFKSMNAKNEHHATVHMQVKRHRCPHCSESFRNYFQRNKHIISTHGLKVKEFKCNLCPKVFLLSGKLGHHVRTVHLKLKRHACELCEWKFYSKSELKEHMIRHGDVKKHQCDVCKKSYARKHTLREHLRIHEDDRRFVCSICGKSFIQNCSLKHHVKVHHPFSLPAASSTANANIFR